MPRMNAEIALLEERLEQLIERFEDERAQLRAARRRVATLETENRELKGKVEGACERVAALLERLPQPEGEDV